MKRLIRKSFYDENFSKEDNQYFSELEDKMFQCKDPDYNGNCPYDGRFEYPGTNGNVGPCGQQHCWYQIQFDDDLKNTKEEYSYEE